MRFAAVEDALVSALPKKSCRCDMSWWPGCTRGSSEALWLNAHLTTNWPDSPWGPWYTDGTTEVATGGPGAAPPASGAAQAGAHATRPAAASPVERTARRERRRDRRARGRGAPDN